MSTRKLFDVTPEQREILLWKDEKRKQLREMYLRDSQHPTKSLLCDTGIYRFAAARNSIETFFVPSVVNYVTRFGVVIASIVLTAVAIKKRRDAREKLFRTGQISYADRPYRFC